jgi:hypothetical protein
MAAPNEQKALCALKAVQNLDARQLDEAITAELGNPMLGVLDSLARALLPDLPDDKRHRAVHLMVLSYLMRCELEKADKPRKAK